MKILILSDDFIEGEFLRHALEFNGFKHCFLSSVDEVEKFMVNNEVDLVLTYSHHNFFNGLWHDKFFHSSEGRHHPKIILLGTLRHEPTVLSLYQSNVHQYFTMPIQFPVMIKNINKLISKL